MMMMNRRAFGDGGGISARPMAGAMAGGGRRFGMQPVMPGRASYKRGGKVKKTGPAKLHKGERVLTKRQAAKYRKGGRGKER